MEFNAHTIQGIAYAVIIFFCAVVITASVIWRKFRNFMVEELSERLMSPLKAQVDELRARADSQDHKIELIETRQLENQTSIQQKFETLLRDMADMKGKIEGVLGKFEIYLTFGEKYGKKN